MFLTFEEGISDGICNKVHSYAEVNDKYMKNYDKNKEPSFLMYADANNLYGWAMSKKLPLDGFKWADDIFMFTKEFIKIYDEEGDVGYSLVVDTEYPKKLRMLHSDLPFLPDRMKVNKVKELICNVTDKENYSVHTVALKQALNHGLVLKKVHSVISFRQETWLKSYIDLNTELRKNAKNEFEKDFYKLKITSIYGKTVQNDRKHRDIKLVTAEYKRNKLASEPNYHSTKCKSKHLLVMEMKKTEVKINKPIYLGQAVLDLSRTLMFEFWYDYLKPMYGDKIRSCYTDTDSFIIHIKIDDFYKDITADVDKWFDTSKCDKNDNRPLEIGKNKNVLGKFKNELGGKIMTKFVALRAKTYSFLIDEYTDEDYEKNRIVNKKAKGTKKCVVKRKILFNNYLDSLFKNKVLYRSQQQFRSDHHKVYTEEVNKIALISNDDKRIQIFDRVTTYSYGTNVFKFCENEMLLKKNKVIYDQEKYRLGTDDYLSTLMDCSKKLSRNIDIYEKLKSINSKISMVTHTSNFI